MGGNVRIRREKNIESKLKEFENTILFDENTIIDKIKYRKNIDLEIGMGKGSFLKEKAYRSPDKFFIGIERSDGIALKAMRKFRNFKNIAVLICNVEDIPNVFNSVFDNIYLNFSDPWPKARHFKRRLLYRSYLDIYDKWMKNKGIVHFKTDNDLLFEFALEELNDTNRLVFDITKDMHNDNRYFDNIITEYEIKFSKKGYKIKGLKFFRLE